jgi:uncharacterized membrane protein YagU involved in acid resistance
MFSYTIVIKLNSVAIVESCTRFVLWCSKACFGNDIWFLLHMTELETLHLFPDKHRSQVCLVP